MLLGRTGSGKSAFLRSTIGLMRDHSGTLQVLGFNPFIRRQACSIRAVSGFVPQNKSAYSNFTVHEMCRFSRTMFPSWQPHIEARLLDRFELPAGQKVRALSPTRRAMLSVTLALSHQPKLLLLDEPFDDVDPGAAHEILQALVEAVGEGATVLLATNYPERVETVADRAIFFQDGSIRLQVSAEVVASDWKAVRAHFATAGEIPAELPLAGIEHHEAEGTGAEWLMSSNAREAAAILHKLGARSVQVHSLSLTSLCAKLLR